MAQLGPGVSRLDSRIANDHVIADNCIPRACRDEETIGVSGDVVFFDDIADAAVEDPDAEIIGGIEVAITVRVV